MSYKLGAVLLGVLLVGLLVASASKKQSPEQPIQVTYPHPGQLISSPLQVTGLAPHHWFVDSQFEVDLNILGEVFSVASNAAHVTETFQGGWAGNERNPFAATLYFDEPPRGSRGILVLRSADSPSEQVDIPVQF